MYVEINVSLNVFFFFLNKVNDFAFLTDTGKPFHNLGPATENLRSPYVFSLDPGTCSNLLEQDLRE